MHVSVYAIITTKDTQVTGVDINAVWLSCGDKKIGDGLENHYSPKNPKTIVAITNGSDQIDNVTYSHWWGASDNGKTLARIDPFYGNSDDSANWSSQIMGGTPGWQN